MVSCLENRLKLLPKESPNIVNVKILTLWIAFREDGLDRIEEILCVGLADEADRLHQLSNAKTPVLHDLIERDGNKKLHRVRISEDLLRYEAIYKFNCIPSRVIEAGNVGEVNIHLIIINKFWHECLTLVLRVTYLQKLCILFAFNNVARLSLVDGFPFLVDYSESLLDF